MAGVRELLATGVGQNALGEDGASALMAAAFSGEVEAGADTDLQVETAELLQGG